MCGYNVFLGISEVAVSKSRFWGVSKAILDPLEAISQKGSVSLGIWLGIPLPAFEGKKHGHTLERSFWRPKWGHLEAFWGSKMMKFSLFAIKMDFFHLFFIF